ncbi:MAG TPA: glycosyltransferase N-terminal domain-containing protein [Cytophagaceae bacterium]|jgi:3-deoxy-D-manno-octulosonic-acid transferase
MVLAFYNLFLRFYFFSAKLIAPFNRKAALFTEGRKNLFSNLEAALNDKHKNLAWFHCSSLGEFEQARPVIEAFRKEYTEYQILLTFFSPSGYEIRKNYEGADYIFYLPIDSRESAVKFLNLTNPEITYFTKYEFWYYYLDELQKRKIPTICFSAKFREDQVFFKPYGKFYRSFLLKFSHFFVQDVRSIELLQNIKVINATVAGDTRFDRVLEISKKVKPVNFVENFLCGSDAFIVGSSWKEDLEILIPFINIHHKIKFIIAPHEIHEDEILNMRKKINRGCIRFTEISERNDSNRQVLILDTIGQLSQVYQYGSYAYIGGGFGKGIHNILEAATFGMPIFFGPNYFKFQEAKDLLNIGGAFRVSNLTDLQKAFDALEKAQYRLEAGRKSREYVQEMTGATEKILNYTKSILAN